MVAKKGWSNVRVPTALLDEVQRLVSHSDMFTSKADFVKTAVREKLDRSSSVFIARDFIRALKSDPLLKSELKSMLRK